MPATITVLDSSAAPQTVNTLPALGQAAKASALPVTVATDDTGYKCALSFTRTADTAVYAINDVLGTGTGASGAVLTFTNMAPSGGGEMLISNVSLEIDRNTLIAGETSYRLYLYNVTPPSALGDNAAWDLPSGDRASFLGYIEMGSPVDLGSTCFVKGVSGDVFTLSGTSVFGYLVTNGTYTPQSATVHVITLHATRAQS